MNDNFLYDFVHWFPRDDSNNMNIYGLIITNRLITGTPKFSKMEAEKMTADNSEKSGS